MIAAIFNRGKGGRARNAVAFSLLCASLQAGAVALPAYNADISQTSVSGLSSGGFMAVQMHVAYSSIMKGAGVFAGGPFYCAQGQLGNATGYCMAATSTFYMPNAQTYIDIINNWSAAGTIDNKSNLTNQRIFMFGGNKDTTVYPLVMDSLYDMYKAFVPTANTAYNNRFPAAAHTHPTVSYGGPCGTTADPWIGNCGYDGAGEALKWIYGSLNAPSATLGGQYIAFDQSEFLASPASHSIANTGYVYVPASCAGGALCRVHVAFHGCKQYATGTVGDKYYTNAGYNRWADSNDMIVLYPQTIASNAAPTNPNGCWDWWGYDDPNYSKKSGRQMLMVKKMIDRLTSGSVPAALPAPAGLAVTATTSASVSLSWNAVSGAAGYYVYRSGVQVNAGTIAGTAYTDSGLAAATGYSYTVKAVTSGGAAGAASAPVNATTSASTGTPPPAPAAPAVTSTTASAVSLGWTATGSATGYNVYRNGTKANAAAIGATSYTDSGLAAATTYSYALTAVNANGESAQSAAVSATTKSAWTCTTSFANNYSHVLAGRAHDSGGYALANGSNQNMGLDNVFFTQTLAQTSAGYYVIGNCP